MIADGLTGRKGKGGFYRMESAATARRSSRRSTSRPASTADASRRAWRASTPRRAPAKGRGLRALVEHPDRGGRYAWRMLSQTLAYAASLVPADRRRHRLRRRGDAHRLQLGVGAVRAARPDRPRLVRRAARGRGPAGAGAARARWATGTFYRVEGGKLQQLRVIDGSYSRRAARPRACCCSPTSSAPAKPVAKNGSAQPLGSRRRRPLPRVPHQDERARRRRRCACSRKAIGLIDGSRRWKALVIYNEGEQLLGRRQHRHRPVRRQHRALAGDRGADRRGASRSSRR